MPKKVHEYQIPMKVKVDYYVYRVVNLIDPIDYAIRDADLVYAETLRQNLDMYQLMLPSLMEIPFPHLKFYGDYEREEEFRYMLNVTNVVLKNMVFFNEDMRGVSKILTEILEDYLNINLRGTFDVPNPAIFDPKAENYTIGHFNYMYDNNQDFDKLYKKNYEEKNALFLFFFRFLIM